MNFIRYVFFAYSQYKGDELFIYFQSTEMYSLGLIQNTTYVRYRQRMFYTFFF